MKKLFFLVAVALIGMAAISRETPADTKVIGAWKVVRAQYGNEPMTDQGKDEAVYKMFTGTRWSGAFYNRATKKFDGAGGGSYTIKGDQYVEKVEYYSWDSEVVGKTFTFTLKMECFTRKELWNTKVILTSSLMNGLNALINLYFEK